MLLDENMQITVGSYLVRGRRGITHFVITFSLGTQSPGHPWLVQSVYCVRKGDRNGNSSYTDITLKFVWLLLISSLICSGCLACATM